ncbi:uncharacterized protein LOC131847855 isoform X2 [Achroia grisella]|uniref:uncharacterized protein LOC131847855 isoform X2 n=1 Tax=Achroia grisella TaxID=688607 RepID=UPI0027D25284|nr:uncharacterized protein LOC131847855 isoform X2 [Achroia grisella]
MCLPKCFIYIFIIVKCNFGSWLPISGKRSKLWNYFKIITSKRQRCLLCGIEICMNMARHLRAKHPKAYRNYKGESRAVFPNLVDKVTTCDRGWIKKYFTELTKSRYQCIICSIIVVVPIDSFNNLKGHIEISHPDVFDEVMNSNDSLFDDDLDSSLQTKNKIRKYRSWVRKYCRRISVTKYQCLVCDNVLRLPNGQLGNMSRHFKCKHYSIFDQETNNKNTAIAMMDDGLLNDGLYVNNDEVSLSTESGKSVIILSSEQNTYDIEEQVIEESADATSEINDTDLFVFVNKLETTTANDVRNETLIENDKYNIITEVTPSTDVIDTKTNNLPNIETVKQYIEIDIISESNPDLERKVKELCRKSTSGMRKNKSSIWNFFKAIDENRLYACLFCGKVMTILPQVVSNLRRHISLVHKKPYALILKYEEEQEKMQTSDKLLNPETEEFDISYFDTDIEGEYKCKLCSTEREAKCGNTLNQ